MQTTQKIAIIISDQRTTRSSFYDLKDSSYIYILFAPEQGILDLDEDSKSLFFEMKIISKDITADELVSLIKPYLKLASLQDIHLVTSREVFMSRVADVNEQLSLSGPKPKDIERFVNKLTMKKVAAASGIRVPWHMEFDGGAFKQYGEAYLHKVDQLIKSGNEYPVFVKPIDQEGSIGAKKIDNYADLVQWSKDPILMQFQYEVDEYVNGDLYECDCIIKNGEIVYEAVSKYTHPNADFSQGKVLGSLIVLPEDPIWKKITDFNKILIKGIKAPDGATHHEIFHKSNGELVFLEIGARPPGAYVCQTHTRNTSVNFETAHFRSQLNILDPLVNDMQKSYSAWGYFPKFEGEVAELYQPKLKSQHEIKWYVNVGDTIKASSHIAGDNQLSGVIFLYNKNYQELQKDFNTLKDFEPMRMVAPM